VPVAETTGTLIICSHLSISMDGLRWPNIFSFPVNVYSYYLMQS